jgi:hypothetical protein
MVGVAHNAEAQSLLFGRDSVRASKHPRSPFRINRIDRGVGKDSFAYKGEWICGISASYGTLTTDDTTLALLVDNLKLGGSIVSVKPYFGYFYRNNLAIGARFGYTHMGGHFDNADVDLSDFINDMNFGTGGIKVGYLSNAYSFSIFHRPYVPIDKRGRFGVFGELELEGQYGRSNFKFHMNEEWHSSISDTYKAKFNFNPGIAAYIFPNVCATISFGLGGLQYTHIKQFDAQMNTTGTRDFSKLAFRLNIAEINIGVTVHLWSKKNEQNLKLQND